MSIRPNRSLRFESLEIRTSLTADLGVGGIDFHVQEIGPDLVSTVTPAVPCERILHYVSNLENILVQRDVPTAAHAKAADAWLSSNLPSSDASDTPSHRDSF